MSKSLLPLVIAGLLTVSCGPEARPGPSAPTAPRATTVGTSSASSAEREKRPPFEPFATLKTSGAESCRASHHDLGAAYFLQGFPTPVVSGFGPRGGLVTWLGPGSTSLKLRALSRAGEPQPGTHEITVPKNLKPRRVVALDKGFLVIGELYGWMNMRWAAVVTDSEGRPQGAITELDLHHRYLQDVSPAQGRRVVIFATRALMVPDEQEGVSGRWLEIDVAAGGNITQTPRELSLAFPLVRALDEARAFELDGKPAWYISRGEQRGELVANGEVERMSWEDAEQRGIPREKLVPRDRVELVIEFGPEGVRIHRTAAGRAVGKPTEVPPGEMALLDSHAWSGTAWVFGHAMQAADSATARIMLLDCR